MESEDPKIEDLLTANAKAFSNLRDIAGDLRSVVEHEVMIDDSISKSIEINTLPKKPSDL
jgi:hypothetical protein